MTKQKLRWGFLSTAQIGRKNWKAIRNSGNSIVTAVASRDLERSRQFIAECQAEAPMETLAQPLGTYEELLASKEVDAVYIPLPTGLRKEWVIRAAEAGKHVLCEKPCATSVADLREMLEACRRHKVQFMDGVMFMHSRRLDKMRELLDHPSSVGPLRRITSAFSFRADEDFFTKNIRADSGLEPYGALGDLGWYCIRFALWTMKERLPHSVTGRILSEGRRPSSAGTVPSEFSGELFFDGGVSSGFYCSFLTHDEQWGIISGDKGSLQLSDFVVPFFGYEVSFTLTNTALAVAGCDFNMEARQQRIAIAEYGNSHPSSQETNLFRNFSAAVLAGVLNQTWPDIALKTQRVMNACFESAQSGSRAVELI